MKSYRSRGSSLVEALVALGIFGLVVSLIAGVFILSHRYTRISRQVSAAQREAARCMQAFYVEVTRGSSETFPVVAGVDETWFLSNRPLESRSALGEFSDHGEILWHKWVGIWREPDGVVYRSELPLVGGAQPFEDVNLATGPASIAFFSVAVGKRRIASAIRSFRVSVESRVVTIELESETSNAGNPSTRYHMASSFLVP